MRKLIALTLLVTTLVSPTYASDLEERCIAKAAEIDGDATGCACFAENAEGAVAEEILAIASTEPNLTEEAQKVVELCWPQAQG